MFEISYINNRVYIASTILVSGRVRSYTAAHGIVCIQDESNIIYSRV